jgi:hypothetical protein
MKLLRWLLVFLLVSSMLIALFGSGGWLLRSQEEEVREGWASRSWPAAPARIVRSAAVHKYAASASRRSGQGTHVIDLRYAFEVAGKVYVGRRQSLDWEGKVLTADAAQKHVQGFPMGSMLTVYYDPADPTRSILEPGVPVGGVLGSVLGALLVAGGAALLLFVIRLNMRRRT